MSRRYAEQLGAALAELYWRDPDAMLTGTALLRRELGDEYRVRETFEGGAQVIGHGCAMQVSRALVCSAENLPPRERRQKVRSIARYVSRSLRRQP